MGSSLRRTLGTASFAFSVLYLTWHICHPAQMGTYSSEGTS
jgi:hypothetical protein